MNDLDTRKLNMLEDLIKIKLKSNFYDYFEDCTHIEKSEILHFLETKKGLKKNSRCFL